MKVDKELDKVFLNLVNRAQFYNNRSEELIESIYDLEEQARKTKNNQYIVARLNAQKKQKYLIDKQIQNLERYMKEMMEGQVKFKEQRNIVLEAYFKQKMQELTPGGEDNED